MIDKLTKNQEDLLLVYRDKWLKIGLSTDQFDLNFSKKIIDKLYKNILNKNNVPIVILDSPLSAWLGVSMLSRNRVRDQVENQVDNQVRNQVDNQVLNQVGDQVLNQVGDQVENQVLNQVRNQIWNRVRDQVRNQVLNQVLNQVWKQVWKQVDNQVENQVRNQIWNRVLNQVSDQVGDRVRNQAENQICNFIWPCIDGSFSANYFSFTDYLRSVLNVSGFVSGYDIYESTAHLGLVYPLDHVCIVSQKPIEINMKERVLHKDGSAAVKYKDGFSVWCLNGVSVSKVIAETPSQELKSSLIKSEVNAQVRTEIIKKIGYSRILKDLKAKKMDGWKEYELYRIDDTIDVEPMFLLKFNCPSTGTFYSLRVPPDTKTAKEAITYCNHGVEPGKFLIET